MTKRHLNFSGKTALITGASQGIGLATAEILSKYGATVVLAARSIDMLREHAQRISTQDVQAYAAQCDVSDYQSVTHAVNNALSYTGRLDILVNNAGTIDPLSTLIESDPESWSRAVDVNYKGVYYCMRAAIPHMLKQDDATVVNISSGAANSALVGWSHYCSTKAAAKKLTEVAHKELAEHNIRIVGLSPGTVATDMMKKIKDSQLNAVSNLDWNQHISPQWAGEAVAFLCGPEGEQFAGTDFSIKTPEGRKLVGLPAENAPDA